MNIQALLFEILLSAFFALACFRARGESPSAKGLAPQRLFVLTNRLERLQRSRWQWCSMVILMIVARQQFGVPLIVELTALAEFIVFLALPSGKPGKNAYGIDKRVPLCRRASE